MHLTDRDIGRARALVIDANPTSRSVMCSQLRDLGVESIRQSARIADARVQLERESYDIVLCDYHFAGTDMTGQDLLDELRREQLLPWSTVFIMVTGEATYAKVVEAAESALDGYLVKPYRAAALAERLIEARQRKRVLADIFTALDSHDIDRTVELCVERFEQRQVYWRFAARLAGELELQRQRPAAALRLFEAVVKVRPLPWAQLGVARARWANGDTGRARHTIDALLKDHPEHADAYDVLGCIQLEQGEAEQSLATFRMAANLTPGCLVRLQQCGAVAFYRAHDDEALQLLERTIKLGLRSKLFDPLTLIVVALLHFDRGDANGVGAVSELLALQAARQPSSRRLQGLCRSADALRIALAGDPGTALALAQDAAAGTEREALDAEAASVAVALMARLPPEVLSDADAAALVRPLALRFCISRGSTETMAAYARPRPELAGLIRQCHTDVARMAEEAIAHSVRGLPEVAVRQLLSQGEQTRNAKLIELAALVARRHQQGITNSVALVEQAASLQRRFGLPPSHLAADRRTCRAPGGLVLRTPLPA